MTRLYSTGVVVLALAGMVLAQDAPLATITKVVKEARPEATNPLPQADTLLPKFTDEDALRGETYAIYWTATGHGLPPGATVLFEYILDTAPEVRALHIQYDFKTEGARKAVFTIPEKDYRDGGNVKAWRVRILRGRLLAETTSPNWREATARK